MDYDAVTYEPDLCVPLYLAFCYIAAGNFTCLADSKYLSDFCCSDNNFFGFPSAQAVVWTGNELDLIRLSLGNVYRTKREARKAIRRNILRGQSMIKEFKNNA